MKKNWQVYDKAGIGYGITQYMPECAFPFKSISGRSWTREGLHLSDRPSVGDLVDFDSEACIAFFTEKDPHCLGHITGASATTKKETTTMNVQETIKTKAVEAYAIVKPYERYVILGAFLFAVDHYILGGKYRGRLVKIAQRVFTRVESIVTKGLDKLLGE